MCLGGSLLEGSGLNTWREGKLSGGRVTRQLGRRDLKQHLGGAVSLIDSLEVRWCSARVAVAQDVTSSLRANDAGATAEGIVTFPAQASAGGLTLRMTLRGPGGPTVFDFALGGLIHPIPVAIGSPSPSP